MTGTNGLPDAERGTFYHLSEGGEIFPLDWALALETEVGAQGDRPEVRPFLDNPERYGLLPDPKSPGNPYGLPVGISVAPSKISGIQMIGINCNACHTGQLQYQGHAMRMDGGPNLVLINNFLKDLAAETQDTLSKPARMERFWRRVRDVRNARRAADPDPVTEDSLWSRAVQMFTQERGLLQSRVDFLRAIPTLAKSLGISTVEGYGRLDAFGIGRDELFGAIGANSLPADAPVSFPHIWGLKVTGWLQWGANTNSVMERNIGQALGVGALVDRNTFRSTVRLDNLHQLENTAYRLEAPAWPAFMPQIDTAKAERGRAAYTKYCAQLPRDVDDRRTDARIQAVLDRGDRHRSDDGAQLRTSRAQEQRRRAALSVCRHGSDQESQSPGLPGRRLRSGQTIEQWEERYVRAGPRWDPTFRAPLLHSDQWPDTKGRKVYRSKTLVGIWATAPFLHNGSVPTHLRSAQAGGRAARDVPARHPRIRSGQSGLSERPHEVPAGGRHASVHLRHAARRELELGHEWKFYPELTDEIRYEIIEFLKTYSKEMTFTPAPAPPAPAASTRGQ